MSCGPDEAALTDEAIDALWRAADSIAAFTRPAEAAAAAAAAVKAVYLGECRHDGGKIMQNRRAGCSVCLDCGVVVDSVMFDHDVLPAGAAAHRVTGAALHTQRVYKWQRKYLFSEIVKQWTGESPVIPDKDWVCIRGALDALATPCKSITNATVYKVLRSIKKDPEHATAGTRWQDTRKFKRRTFGIYRERAAAIRMRYAGERSPAGAPGGKYCAGPPPPSPELLEVVEQVYTRMVREFSAGRHVKGCPAWDSRRVTPPKGCHRLHGCRKHFPTRGAIRWILKWIAFSHQDAKMRGAAKKQLEVFPTMTQSLKRAAVGQLLLGLLSVHEDSWDFSLHEAEAEAAEAAVACRARTMTTLRLATGCSISTRPCLEPEGTVSRPPLK